MDFTVRIVLPAEYVPHLGLSNPLGEVAHVAQFRLAGDELHPGSAPASQLVFPTKRAVVVQQGAGDPALAFDEHEGGTAVSARPL